MVKEGFLTKTDEKILTGKYEGTDTARASARSRLKRRARGAVEDLVQVAVNPEIDNSDVFDPDQIHKLLVNLMTGSPGMVIEDTPQEELPPPYRATEVDHEYLNAIYVATLRAQLHAERQADKDEIYELLGERAAQLLEHQENTTDEETEENTDE